VPFSALLIYSGSKIAAYKPTICSHECLKFLKHCDSFALFRLDVSDELANVLVNIAEGVDELASVVGPVQRLNVLPKVIQLLLSGELLLAEFFDQSLEFVQLNFVFLGHVQALFFDFFFSGLPFL